jgi:5'-nucleotidase
MRFLLTNDDGIEARGLAAMEAVLQARGTVCVVAPERPMSSCGHRVTTDAPLVTRKLGPNRFAVDGAPADCVRLGLLHFAPEVDWVVSGINAGGNLGVDVFMSGTVAAAREAALLGRPAIAISQYRTRAGSFRWERSAAFAEFAWDQLRAQPLASGEFWNVNLPSNENEEGMPKLVECPAEPQPLAVRYEREGDQFRYRGVYQERPRRDGSDVDLCFRGQITASRLSSAVVSAADPPFSSPRTT